jgi:hypothetical protein
MYVVAQVDKSCDYCSRKTDALKACLSSIHCNHKSIVDLIWGPLGLENQQHCAHCCLCTLLFENNISFEKLEELFSPPKSQDNSFESVVSGKSLTNSTVTVTTLTTTYVG